MFTNCRLFYFSHSAASRYWYLCLGKQNLSLEKRNPNAEKLFQYIFNPYSLTLWPARSTLTQSTNRENPKNFFHSFRMCCSTEKKVNFHIVVGFGGFLIIMLPILRAKELFAAFCVSVRVVWSNELWKNVIFMNSPQPAPPRRFPSPKHHRVFVEPHRRVCLNKNFVITFRASAIIMEMIHLLLH